MSAPRVRNSKLDIRNFPAVPPGYVPPPSAGVPVRSNADGGGALTEGYSGRMGREWKPARTKGYAFFCECCGLGYGNEGEAARCCEPDPSIRYSPDSLLSRGQIDMVKRRTRLGDGPKAILEYMRLDSATYYAAVQHHYNHERLRIMAEKGLDLDGWKAYQRMRRSIPFNGRGAKR